MTGLRKDKVRATDLDIRDLTSASDDVSVTTVKPDGTNTMPSGDDTARPVYVRLTDETTDNKLCASTGAIITKDSVSKEVGLGLVFVVSHLFINVADNGYAYMRVSIPADYNINMGFVVDAESKAYIYMYEDTTFSANGTALTPYNQNRESTNTLNTLFYHTPTINAAGTLIRSSMLGSAGKFTSTSGSASTVYSKRLAESTEYLIAVQNKGGDVRDINIRIICKEVEC